MTGSAGQNGLAAQFSMLEGMLGRHVRAARELVGQLGDLHADAQMLSAQLATPAEEVKPRPASSSPRHSSHKLSLPCRQGTALAALHPDLPGTTPQGPQRAKSLCAPEGGQGPSLAWTGRKGDDTAVRFAGVLSDGESVGRSICERNRTNSSTESALTVVHRRSKRPATLPRPLLPHAEDLQEQLRLHLGESHHNTCHYYHSSGIFQRVARSPLFETSSLILVLLNSVWIAVDIDHSPSVVLTDAPPVFQAVAHLFCTLFVLELLVRFMAFRQTRHAVRDGWFVFDFFLVVLIVAETWLAGLLMAITDMQQSAGTSRIRMMAVLRMLRLARVIRVARVLRKLPELLVICRGIFVAFRALIAVFTLLGFIIYVSAIVLRVLMDGTGVGVERFRTVPVAMATLLLEGTLSGARGGPLILEAYEESWAFAALILLFVLLANVTMMGVLGGLLVQTVRTVADAERDESSIRRADEVMEELWELMRTEIQHLEPLHEDANGRPLASEESFVRLLAGERTDQIMQSIGVDPEGIRGTAAFIFEQHEGFLCKSQFKSMLLDLRGKNAAKVKDHVETRKFVHALLKGPAAKRPAPETLE